MKIDTRYLMHSKLPDGDMELVYTLPWRMEGWKRADMDKLCEEFLANIPKDGFVVELASPNGREFTVAMSGLVVRASFPYGHLKD